VETVKNQPEEKSVERLEEESVERQKVPQLRAEVGARKKLLGRARKAELVEVGQYKAAEGVVEELQKGFPSMRDQVEVASALVLMVQKSMAVMDHWAARSSTCLGSSRFWPALAAASLGRD